LHGKKQLVNFSRLRFAKTMKVILLQDIPKVGRKNEVKDVSDGFARNFLLARNLAKPATASAIDVLSRQITRETKEKSEEQQKNQTIVEKINKTVLKFKVKVGEKGKKTNGLFAGSLLTEASQASVIRKRSQGFPEEGNRAFGSVTPLKITEALKKQGVEIEKDWISLEESIKTTGEHKVKIKFPQGVSGEVKIIVEAE